MRRAFRLAILLSTVLAAPVIPGARAQDGSGLASSTPEQRASIQTSLMKEKLSLDAAQLSRVEAINLDTARQMEPLLHGSGGTLSRMRQGRAIQLARDEALREVLTAAQFEEYRRMKADLKRKIHEKLDEKRGAARR